MNNSLLQEIMEEQTLVKLALCTAILGIVTLFFITPRLTLQDQAQNNIFLAEDEDQVRLQGYVQEIQEKEGVVFLKLHIQDTKEIVLFTDDPLNISTDDYVEVTGKVSTYQGKQEVIGETVKILTN